MFWLLQIWTKNPSKGDSYFIENLFRLLSFGLMLIESLLIDLIRISNLMFEIEIVKYVELAIRLLCIYFLYKLLIFLNFSTNYSTSIHEQKN